MAEHQEADGQQDGRPTEDPHAERPPGRRPRGRTFGVRRLREGKLGHHAHGAPPKGEREEDRVERHDEQQRGVGDDRQAVGRTRRERPRSAATLQDDPQAQCRAERQKGRTRRVVTRLRPLQEDERHVDRRDRQGKLPAHQATHDEKHGRRDREHQQEVQMSRVHHEARDVVAADDAEQLDERVLKEAAHLGQILLVHERHVPQGPAPRHDDGEALVLQIDAEEETLPGVDHGRGGACERSRGEHSRGRAAAPVRSARRTRVSRDRGAPWRSPRAWTRPALP